MSSLKMSDSDPTLFQGLNLRSLLENSDLLSTVTHASESLVRFFVFFDAVSPPPSPAPSAAQCGSRVGTRRCLGGSSGHLVRRSWPQRLIFVSNSRQGDRKPLNFSRYAAIADR